MNKHLIISDTQYDLLCSSVNVHKNAARNIKPLYQQLCQLQSKLYKQRNNNNNTSKSKEKQS